MTIAVNDGTNDPAGLASEGDRNLEFVRLACWFVTIGFGAADAWVTRFTMYPDGVSYLDLGDAIWRGDWHNAINAYWSPLYPAITGMFLKVFKPSIEHEYPLVHLINFLIYLAALISFEYFWRRFVAQRRERNDPDQGFPIWAWYIVGYCAFISSALRLITINFVSGDMAIAAVVYLACALLLKMQQGDVGWKIFACLGLVLGIGYLTKAVMFLISIPFFAVAAAIQRKLGRSMKPVALSLLAFGVIAGPWVLALSKAKGRPTFGDTGKINYAINVSTVNFFIPRAESTKHPVHQLAGLPTYEFSQPISGTYPLWYDPSYWHEGIEPHFNLKKQVSSILTSLLSLGWISFNLVLALSITVAIVFFYLTAPNISGPLARARANWIVWIPAVCGIALYSLVVIEPRYVGALFCLLWIVAFSGLRFATSSRKLMTVTVILLAFSTCAVEVWQISRALDPSYFARRHVASHVSVEVAAALKAEGFQRGDKIVVVGDWLVPSQEASYVARLARICIIGEARPDELWSAAPLVRNRILAEFEQAGAQAILMYRPRPSAPNCEQLVNSEYYLCRIASQR